MRLETEESRASANTQPVCGKLRQSFRASLATAHQGRTPGRKESGSACRAQGTTLGCSPSPPLSLAGTLLYGSRVPDLPGVTVEAGACRLRARRWPAG